MSVILFEQTQIDTLIGMMRYHHENIARTLRYTPSFSHYVARFQRSGQTVDIDQALEGFIGRMLWYALVSNKLAYALQYHERVNLEDIYVLYKSTHPMACTPKQLFHELGHLIYNVATNDGNKFIEQKWYEPLEAIYNTLARTEMYK